MTGEPWWETMVLFSAIKPSCFCKSRKLYMHSKSSVHNIQESCIWTEVQYSLVCVMWWYVCSKNLCVCSEPRLGWSFQKQHRWELPEILWVHYVVIFRSNFCHSAIKLPFAVSNFFFVIPWNLKSVTKARPQTMQYKNYLHSIYTALGSMHNLNVI